MVTNRIVLGSGATFGIQGGPDTNQIFGTTGNETITVAIGAKVVLDASFNRGGDLINMAGNAASYTAVRSGSSIILTDASGSSVTIPVGTVGATVKFADASPRTLVFDTNTNTIKLGAETVTTTSDPVDAGNVSLPAITVGAPSITEGNSGTKQLAFLLTLDQAPTTAPITVNVVTAGGTATAGDDYVAIAQQVTFGIGQTQAFVNVTVNGDTVVEATETVILSVSGGGIAASVSGTGTITNDDTNVAPVFGVAPTVTVNEDGTVVGSVSATDGDNDALTFSLATGAANGTVTVAANGTFTYSPAANYSGADSFVVRVSDGRGGIVTQTVNVTVNGVNDAPTFAFGSQTATVTENIGTGVIVATATAADIDGPNALSYSLSGPDAALFNINAATGAITFKASPNFESPQSQAGSNTYTVVVVATDGGAVPNTATQTVTINVTNLNEEFGSGTDNLNGTAQDDVFFVRNGDLQSGDNVNGQGGNDTVFHGVDSSNTASNFAGFVFTGVEKFSVTNDDQTGNTQTGAPATGLGIPVAGTDNTVSYDLSSSDFINTIEDLNSTQNVVFNFAKTQNGAVGFNVTNLTDSTADASLNLSADAALGTTTVNLLLSNVDDQRAADIINLGVNGAGAIENVAITTNAANGIQLVNDLNTTGTTAITINSAGGLIIDQALTSSVNTVTQVGGTNGALDIDISAATGATTVNTNDGNDTITGGAVADTINVRGGNNSVNAGDGNNSVTAANGNNTIVTGTGADTVNVGTGSNEITTGDGTDTVNVTLGGTGANKIDTGAGNDSVNAGDGADVVLAGAGNDVVKGFDGNDYIVTGDGVDNVDGGAGNDTINGSSFFNAGGIGFDTIAGGTGANELRINAGSVDANFQNVTDTQTLSVITHGSTTLNSGVTTYAQTGAKIATVNLDVADPIEATAATQVTTTEVNDGDDTLLAGNYTADLVVNLGGNSGTLGAGDSVVTGSGNDTFNFRILNGAFGDTDTLTGGAGSDTVNVDGDTTLTTASAFSEIERLNLLSGHNNPTAVDNDYSIAVDNSNHPTSNGTLIVDGSALRAATGLLDNETLTFTAAGVVAGANSFAVDVRGGEAADTLTDGVANDTLTGNGGADAINLSGGGNNSVDAGAGADTITLSANGNENISAGTGNDTIKVNGGGSNRLNSADVVDGGADSDTIQANAGLVDSDFTQVSNVEVLTVQDSVNTSTVLDDEAEQAGIRTVNLSNTNVLNASGYSADAPLTVNGGGNNNISTGAAGDTINLASSAGNTVASGAGNDTVVAATSADNINLGDGTDVYRVSGGELTAAETLDGGAGTDTVELDNPDTGVVSNAVTARVDLDTVDSIEVYKLTSSGQRTDINGNIPNDVDANTLRFTDGDALTVQQITVDARALTDLDDSFTITLEDDLSVNYGFLIQGSATSDTLDKLNVGENDIVFNGLGGDDTVRIQGGDLGSNISFDGGDGTDRIVQANELIPARFTDDDFRTVRNIEVLTTDQTPIDLGIFGQVDGALQADLGSAAAAAFDATKTPSIIGGNGNDDVVLDAAFNRAALQFTLNGGNDTFNAGAAATAVTFVVSGNQLTTADNLTGGTSSGDKLNIDATDGASTSANANNVVNVEEINVTGDDNNPVGESTSFALTLNTVAGDLNGVTAQTINLSGFQSSGDTFTLNGGSATVNLVVNGSTAAGNDTITTGTGADTINAGDGANSITSGTGADSVTSGAGADTIVAGDGNDTVNAGNGNNSVLGGDGTDSITSGTGNDFIDGGTSNDTIVAGAGSNYVLGGTGDDSVTVSSGLGESSTVTGGLGADLMVSNGAGGDQFRYTLIAESGSIIRDTIQGFTSGSDKIAIETQLLAASDPTNVGLTPFNSGLAFNDASLGTGGVDSFSDAVGAISLTANDGRADFILERGGGTNGLNKLWIDMNDDGVLNGLDLQIDVDANSVTNGDIILIDTIAPTFTPVAVSQSEDRLASTVTNSAGLPSGNLGAVDTDGGAVTYRADGNDGSNSVVTMTGTGNGGGGTYGNLVVNEATGAYTYTQNGTQVSAVEALDDGEVRQDVYTITAVDDLGNTTTSTLTVTINGADDQPTLALVTSGAVTEVVSPGDETSRTTSGLSGTLVGADVDVETLRYSIQGESSSVGANSTLADTYGTLTVNRTSGAYNFTQNSTQIAATEALAQGESTTRTFTVRVTDGDDGFVTQTYSVLVTGGNDAPLITIEAGDSAAVTLSETNSIISASDTLTVTDIDANDTVTAAVTAVSASGTLGGHSASNDAAFQAMLSVTGGAIAANAGDLNNITWNFNSGATGAFDYLAGGEQVVLTYTVTATDSGAGATDTQTVTVTVNGSNDAPEITVQAGGSVDSAAVALTETNAVLTASDTLTVRDPDLSNTVSVAVTGVASTGPTGSLSNGDLAAMLTVTGGAINAEPTDINNVTWNFNSGSAGAFDYLQQGETVVLTYTVVATDSSTGAINNTDAQTVTVTISGTNDVPVINSSTNPAAIPEIAGDSSAQDIAATTGTITVTDLDVGNTMTLSVTGNGVAAYNGGALPVEDSVTAAAINALTASSAVTFAPYTSNGGTVVSNWTYNPAAADLDWLRAGDTLTVTYQAQVNDGFTTVGTQPLTLTITGTNDVPVITGATNPAAVAEVAGDSSAQDIPAITGTITTADADLGDTLTYSVTGNATALVNGAAITPEDSITLTNLVASSAISFAAATSNGESVTSNWTYNPAAADLDWLRAGQTLTLTYVAQVTDGAGNVGAQNLVISITGTNDVPVITGATNPAAIAEVAGDSSAQDIAATTGTITVSDQDVGDTLTVSVTGNGVAAYNGGAVPVENSVDVTALIASGAISFAAATSNGESTAITWTYNPAAADLDWLRSGDTLTVTYTAQVNDGAGNVGAQALVITITGSNDLPSITGATNPAAITEVVGDSSAQDITATNGTISVSDQDLNNPLSFQVTGNATASYSGGAIPGSVDLSALIASSAVSLAAGAVTNGETATVNWTYDPAAANLDWLDAGETLTLTYTAQVSDGSGFVGAQPLVISIVGTNDAPTASYVSSAETSSTTGQFVISATDLDAYDPIHLLTAVNGQSAVTDGGNTTFTVQQQGGITTTDIVVTDDTAQTSVIKTLVQGSSNNDTIGATTSNGLYFSFGGADTINAGATNDIIYAGDDNDVVNAGGGADTIIGGAGADALSGEGGADTFIFAGTAAGYVTAADADTITDYVVGTDAAIQIDTINAFGPANVQNGAGTADYATFLANAAGGISVVDVYVEYNVNGAGDTYVFVDYNSDGAVDAGDYSIILDGVSAITAGSFSIA